MEVMGGGLKGESPGLNQGSTFTVTLETVDETVAIDSPRPATPPQRSRQRILIVEDHLDTAMALARLLQTRGHDIRTALTVASALAEIKLHPFDLVICDIGLPDGTGYEVIGEIKKNYSIPSIALTGFGMSDDVDRAIAAGFAAHVTKPVNFLKLEAIIANLSSRAPA